MKDSLHEKLQAEALSQRPAVSPLLHARIMAAIRKSPQTQTPLAQKPRTLRWIAMPLAAALALAAFIFIEYPRPVSPPSDDQSASLPTAADFTAPFSDLLAAAPTPDSLEDPQAKNLDQDAKSLAHFLANQLPSLQ